MARHMYIRSPIGVSTVKKIYGIRSNNGSSPSHWAAGAGGVARKALQALEGLKLAEKDPNGGRRLTSQGRRDLDRIAAQIKLAAAEKAKKAAAGRWRYNRCCSNHTHVMILGVRRCHCLGCCAEETK